MKEGDYVIVHTLSKTVKYHIICIRPENSVKVVMKEIPSTLLIGLDYGSTLEAKGVFKSKTEGFELEVVNFDQLRAYHMEEDTEALPPHDTLRVDNNSQSLAESDIVKMKEDLDGRELVEALATHSKSFAKKSVFSQRKYIQRKQRKYRILLHILRPTARNLCNALYFKSGLKVNYLRMDMLSRLMTYANVSSKKRVLVIEDCSGVVLGTIAERLGGFGEIVVLYTETSEVNARSKKFNFERMSLTEDARSIVKWIPMHHLGMRHCISDEEKFAQKHSVEILQEGFDSFVFVANFVLEKIFWRLWPFLHPSGHFAVFDPCMLNLLPIYETMREHEVVVNGILANVFKREIQVLPERTHPVMKAKMASGYTLSGIKVFPPDGSAFPPTLESELANFVSMNLPNDEDHIIKKIKLDRSGKSQFKEHAVL